MRSDLTQLSVFVFMKAYNLHEGTAATRPSHMHECTSIHTMWIHFPSDFMRRKRCISTQGLIIQTWWVHLVGRHRGRLTSHELLLLLLLLVVFYNQRGLSVLFPQTFTPAEGKKSVYITNNARFKWSVSKCNPEFSSHLSGRDRRRRCDYCSSQTSD